MLYKLHLIFTLTEWSNKRAIHQHSRNKIKHNTIVDNTKVKYREQDQNRLDILEAILILFEKPELNRQDTGIKRKLSLFQQ